jgi:predicted DsbA family dithiol-disulfide isomerase
MTEQATELHIDVYSDVVCPWCYVGKRRLERALDQWNGGAKAHVTWRPFELNPTMPKSGMDRRAYLDAKFGGAEARRAIEERIAKAGGADGIVFAFDRIERTPNTFDAHRLIWFAQQQGKQDDLVEALFHAYFTEGRDIGDDRILIGVGSESGLDGNEVRAFLTSEEGVEEVHAEESVGHRMGIRGVPYFVLNGRYAISGAQPPDVFVSALQKAEGDRAERKAGR